MLSDKDKTRLEGRFANLSSQIITTLDSANFPAIYEYITQEISIPFALSAENKQAVKKLSDAWQESDALKMEFKNAESGEIRDIALKYIRRFDFNEHSLFEKIKAYFGAEDKSTCLEEIALLLKNGANVNAIFNNTTPFLIAIYQQDENLLRLLLAQPNIDINLTTKFQTAPIHQAAIQGSLTIMTLLLAMPDIAFFKKCYGDTALSFAVYYRHNHLIPPLLNAEPELVNEQDDEQEVTPLEMAVLLQDAEAVRLLLKASPNLKHLNKFGESALFLAVDKQNEEIIQLLVMAGADPYHFSHKKGNSPITYAMQFCTTTEIMPLLFNSAVHTSTVCTYLKEDDAASITIFINENSKNFAEQELHLLLFYAFMIKNFKAAEAISSSLNHLHSETYVKKAGTVSFSAMHSHWERKNIIFPAHYPESKQLALRNAFEQISIVLKNTNRCIELLRPVDEYIRKKQKKLNIDFSTITPEKKFVFGGYKWPCPPLNVSSVSNKGLLRNFLRKKLNEQGIDSQDELYCFSGAVEPTEADKIVKKGALFKEDFLQGNSMYHGLLSHYFDWYIVSRAREEGDINFQDDLSLLEVFVASVDCYNTDELPIWTDLIDYSFTQYTDLNFSSPHHLNNTLLSCNLPYLRGYMLDSWMKKISKFKEIIDDMQAKSGKPYSSFEIFYENFIKCQVLAASAFKRFNMGITKEMVTEYYAKKPNSYSWTNKEAGIMEKKASSSVRYADTFFTPAKDKNPLQSVIRSSTEMPVI